MPKVADTPKIERVVIMTVSASNISMLVCSLSGGLDRYRSAIPTDFETVYVW